MTAPTPREPWFHRYPKLTSSTLVVFGCLVALGLGEFTARLLCPEWAPMAEERVKFWTYDALLGWAHIPNQRGRLNHPDFSVEVVTNSQGMRDSEYPMERTEKRRMLVLGDSFGWGVGVEHHERFSEIVEAAHADWEFINASVSGYGTAQEFLFLQERGLAFKPDVILLLFCENDFDNNIYPEEYWHFRPVFSVEKGALTLQNVPVPQATIKQRVKRFLLGKTYLGLHLYSAKDSFVRLIRPLLNPVTGEPNADSGERQKMYDVTYHLITAMDELSRKAHATFILVSIPMWAQDKLTFLQEMATKEGIPHLALDAYFDPADTSLVFPHDVHWTAKGHALAAHAIDMFLQKLGVFEVAKSDRGSAQEISRNVFQ
jgi:GDSL-like Lipase/Acylhydrolase family